LGSNRTIWVVRVDDDLYVRSVNGRTSDWFRRTQRRHEGRIRAGGVEMDVMFVEADADLEDRIEGAYRQKYRRYAKSIVDSALTPPGAIGGAEARAAGVASDPSMGGSQAEREQRVTPLELFFESTVPGAVAIGDDLLAHPVLLRDPDHGAAAEAIHQRADLGDERRRWATPPSVMLQRGEATGVQQQRLQRRRDAPDGSTTATRSRWRACCATRSTSYGRSPSARDSSTARSRSA
jgi:hypothetical protein